ncbi:hypothetical protein CR513_23767, partial [Mucuna pruriens]
MEDLILQFQQNIPVTIHDLKMQVRQLADTSIPNPQGKGVDTVQLRSSRELPQPDKPQLSPGPTKVVTEPGADSQVQQPAKSIPLQFPNRIVSTRISEIDEDLLKLFRKVEINILLHDAIKQVPKYAKFLKELYVHKRKKIKGVVETRGIVLTLVKHEDKCQDPGIFAVPCTIGNRTFTNAMLELGASINVMPTSIYKSLNLGI